jgi:prepilin-type N-terminal cleavage/methylation domain-containing protein
MTLRSNRQRGRSDDAGFSLLEVVVSLAITALVMSVVLTILPGTSTKQADRLRALHASEFAFSLLEEYRVTFPDMAVEGDDPSGWSWRVSERTVEPNPPGVLDGRMAFAEVTVTVWRRDDPDQQTSTSGLVARLVQ